MRSKKAVILFSLLLATMLCGCTKESDRSAYPREEFVMVYYCAGFNDLSSNIQGNLSVLKKADLPFKGSKHKLLTFTHFATTNNDFNTLTPSHLVQLTKDFGKSHADTLLTLGPTRYGTKPEVMDEVREGGRNMYPNAH